LRRIVILIPLVLCACERGEVPGSATDPGVDAGTAGIRFTDVSAGSGITVHNISGSPTLKRAIPESLGSGAAALDYDGDGRLDLFVANGDAFDRSTLPVDPKSALYRNLGGFKFQDVTAEAGLLFDAWAHGASRVDFDADGHPDLYVTVYHGTNRFYRNRGDGTFEDASNRWGGADPGPSTAAAFLDGDGDGDLDLYVANYVLYDPEDPPNNGRPCEWRGLPVYCGPKGTPAAADVYYRNRNGKLIEATDAVGLGGVTASFSLGAAACDYDDDGDLDLYVANDSKANYLFRNEDGRGFREVGMLHGTDRNEDGRAQAGMGVDFGDLDNDGRIDLFVTNFSHDTNTFYRNLLTPSGDTTFEDATNSANLGLASYRYLSWGTRLVDLDRDGWQDIVLVSGHVYPEVDRYPLGSSYRQLNQVFRNLGADAKGRITFEELVPGPGDAFERAAVSRGLVGADLDDDGDLDFLVVEMDEAPTLIRNDTVATGHWIGFLLHGSGGNRDAIGARVEVEDSGGVSRWRVRIGGGSYLSTGDPRLLMGLGPAGGTVRRIKVRWPSGATTLHEDLAVDRYWVLDEEAGNASPL